LQKSHEPLGSRSEVVVAALMQQSGFIPYAARLIRWIPSPWSWFDEYPWGGERLYRDLMRLGFAREPSPRLGPGTGLIGSYNPLDAVGLSLPSEQPATVFGAIPPMNTTARFPERHCELYVPIPASDAEPVRVKGLPFAGFMTMVVRVRLPVVTTGVPLRSKAKVRSAAARRHLGSADESIAFAPWWLLAGELPYKGRWLGYSVLEHNLDSGRLTPYYFEAKVVSDVCFAPPVRMDYAIGPGADTVLQAAKASRMISADANWRASIPVGGPRLSLLVGPGSAPHVLAPHTAWIGTVTGSVLHLEGFEITPISIRDVFWPADALSAATDPLHRREMAQAGIILSESYRSYEPEQMPHGLLVAGPVPLSTVAGRRLTVVVKAERDWFGYRARATGTVDVPVPRP
jgi:hypothetical protein